MKKLRSNIWAKIAVGILLPFIIIVMILSGIGVIVCFKNNIYTGGGVEDIKKELLENEIENYQWHAEQYYIAVYCGDDNEIARYKNHFSENNTNYFFKIKPVSEKYKDLPELSSYTADAGYSEERQQWLGFGEEFTADIILDQNWRLNALDESYQYENESGYIEYVDSVYYKEGKIYCVYDGINIDMSENIKDDSDFKEILHKAILDYDNYNVYLEYDEYEEKIHANVVADKEIEVIITNNIKSDLTADDVFKEQEKYYGYIEFVVDYSLPVFVVTLILSIVLSAVIVVFAGHNPDGEVRLNQFDKVPYDILLGIVAIDVFSICYLLDSYSAWGGTDVELILAFLWAALIFSFPVMLNTTATRLKLGALLKGTLTVKVIKCMVALLKRMFNKVKTGVRYLSENLNIYWKFVGGFIAISVIEFIMTGAFGFETEILGIAWFLEKVAIIILLIVLLVDMNKLKKGARVIAEGNLDFKIDTSKMIWEFKNHGETLNSINDGIADAVEERMKSERMKTELITNVSHDIKTPLTSIINYVDLLEKEKLENEKAVEYIEVLDRQSGRLKKLIQDLIDASKASTGNMEVNMTTMDIKVLLEQVMGEFSEKMENLSLKPMIKYAGDNTKVKADGKLLWRVFDNIFSNIIKYAKPDTRVYIEVESQDIVDKNEGDFISKGRMCKLTFKNISKNELNISGEELMERFVRGDRSRNTEGSGLGLSIAKSLINLQSGKLEIIVDGDLFKVVLLLVEA